MTLIEAKHICREMRKWQKCEFPYNTKGARQPYSFDEYYNAYHVILNYETPSIYSVQRV